MGQTNFIEKILKLKASRSKIIKQFKIGDITEEEKDVLIEKIDDDIKFLKIRLKNK